MINSRAISDLLPEAQVWFWRFVAHASKAGIPYLDDWVVISTYRDQEQQDELWTHGRDGDPRPVVTWTKNSRHTSRKAWDLAIKRGKKIVWESLLYSKLAGIGREMGLVVGFDFKNQDQGHYEAPEGGL